MKKIKKVRKLRGALYRKMKDIEYEQESKKRVTIEGALPGFKMERVKRIIEFPRIDDITKVDITYGLIEPFVYANIKWSPENKEIIYSIIEPELTKEEKKIMESIFEALIELVEVELTVVKEEGKAMKYLEEQINKIMKDFGIRLTPDQYVRIIYYVYRNFIGFNEIDPFLKDPNIEDISCDGKGTPIYIIHRKFGSLKTNVAFNDLEYLREFIIKMAERCGRYVSYAEPLLAGTLPDGSRVSATLAGDVATRGPTFTIRKFSEKPFSPTDQIKLNTVSPEILAYFWYIVEHGASLLVVGGVATGKTSFLNTLCMFIPPEAKIVSIEDTRELRIPNEHWVPTLARSGFGIPMPSGEKYGGVSLFDLLKESFRQNPDYVIVGETRGKEAYVMFQGMSSGHPSMSTFHAGSVDTVVKRLTSPPIELSPTLIESLNVVAIMVHAREKGKSARRIKEVVEIENVDVSGDVNTNVVFRWNAVNDQYERVNDSVMVARFVEAAGGTEEEAYQEIENRRIIIQWMFENNVTDYKEVTRLINKYYKEPDVLLEEIRAGTVEFKKEKKVERVLFAEPFMVPEPIIKREARPKAAKAKPLKAQPAITTLTQIKAKPRPKPKKARLLVKRMPKVEPKTVEPKPIKTVKAVEPPVAAPKAEPAPVRESIKAELVRERESVLGLFGFKFVEEQQKAVEPPIEA